MGGSLSGGLWGLVLGGVGLSVASLVNEQPAGNAPPVMPQLTAPLAVETDDVPVGLASDQPAVESEFALTAPRVPVPAAEVAAIDTDTSPPAPPEAQDIATALALPESVSNPEITAGLEEPLLSRTVTSSPVVPEPEQGVVIATQPAQPTSAAPALDDTDVAGVAEDAAITPEVEAPADVVAPTEPTSEVVTAEPDAVAAVTESVVAEVVEPAPMIVPAPVSTDVAESPLDEEQAPAAQPEVMVAAPEPAPQAPEIVVLPVTEPVTPGPAPEVSNLTETDQTALPQVGGAVRVNRPGAAPTETAGQGAVVVEPDAEAEDAPALVRYAAVFEREGTLPLIAILLMDGGGDESAIAQVAALPFPVSVVLDPLAKDAKARMQAYRDVGIEIVMQTPLPLGAIPTDVEVAFEGAFDILPETVALFSDGQDATQSNRTIGQQVIQVLKSEGRGLIAVQRGLGNALRGAEQIGLPAATVLRDLDGAGESAGAITRALDQAAFRARQSGDAVLLARLTAQTMTALEGWGAQNDGAQITLAPVSAVLLAGSDITPEEQ